MPEKRAPGSWSCSCGAQNGPEHRYCPACTSPRVVERPAPVRRHTVSQPVREYYQDRARKTRENVWRFLATLTICAVMTPILWAGVVGTWNTLAVAPLGLPPLGELQALRVVLLILGVLVTQQLLAAVIRPSPSDQRWQEPEEEG